MSCQLQVDGKAMKGTIHPPHGGSRGRLRATSAAMITPIHPSASAA